MQTVTADNKVRHVTISAEIKYESAKTRIEAEVHRLDDSFRRLLAENQIEELREKLEEASRPHGLMIHYIATHGDWLALAGKRKRAVVYHIGNVLMAIRMTQHPFLHCAWPSMRMKMEERTSNTICLRRCSGSTRMLQSTKLPRVSMQD